MFHVWRWFVLHECFEDSGRVTNEDMGGLIAESFIF
jgi:hypothetical protein